MKRPFAFLGFVALVSSFLTVYVGFVFSVAVCLTAAAVFLLLVKKDRRRAVLAAVMLVFAAVSAVAGSLYSTAVADLAGDRVVSGVVTKTEDYENSRVIELRTKFQGKAFKLRVYDYSDISLELGDKAVLKVELEKLPKTVRTYYLSEGVYLTGRLYEVLSVDKDDINLYSIIHFLQSYIENTLKDTLGERDAAPLIALLTGKRVFLNTDTENAVKNAGVSHIMVVSGLHLGIICGAVVSCLLRLKVKNKTVALAGVVAVFAVIAVCSFHISAIRAAVTYIIMLVGLALFKRADGLNSLGFAVFIISVVNPFIAGSVSFLLSVSATFGVVFIAPILSRMIRPLPIKGKLVIVDEEIRGIFTVSLAASLCTMPILLVAFGSISAAAPIVNLLISHAVSYALILTAAGVILSPIPIINILSTPLLEAAGILSGYFMAVIEFFGERAASVLYFSEATSVITACGCIVLIAFLSFKHINNKRKETEDGAE